jgi:hypothetical protein
MPRLCNCKWSRIGYSLNLNVRNSCTEGPHSSTREQDKPPAPPQVRSTAGCKVGLANDRHRSATSRDRVWIPPPPTALRSLADSAEPGLRLKFGFSAVPPAAASAIVDAKLAFAVLHDTALPPQPRSAFAQGRRNGELIVGVPKPGQLSTAFAVRNRGRQSYNQFPYPTRIQGIGSGSAYYELTITVVKGLACLWHFRCLGTSIDACRQIVVSSSTPSRERSR